MTTVARHPNAKILIVDDEPANVYLLEQILAKGGYLQVVSTTDPTVVSDVARTLGRDIILLDLHMPQLDGFAVMEILAPPGGQPGGPPILVLTADVTPEVKHRALAAGAHDFLTKPLDMEEVLLRMGNHLDLRFLQAELREERDLLEQRVLERTKELEDAQTETFERLALAAEFRDDDTGDTRGVSGGSRR